MFELKITALAAMLFAVIISRYMAVPAGNVSSPGQTLIDTGKELNIPSLELIGKVINDLAQDMCRLHPCSDWSDWSACNYDIAEEYSRFGGQNRTRNCGFNSTVCTRYEDSNVEYEFRVCKCRDGYTVTRHGYCIKYFRNLLKRDAAAAKCHGDGGYLINIGSARKLKDVNDAFQTFSAGTSFWVDGIRDQAAGKWEFENQPEDPSFTYWAPGKPGGCFCKLDQYETVNGKRKLYSYDIACYHSKPFMCEIFP
ncbi:uncharacterized protein LOC123543897 [Mercenaria mercenaria]|uniref:uncharacterized protein LOC123543897 n=1 Tax=Mercenaria mercenaria TaxID=6596 RepID=UPI00234ED19D|nr:uncharacterized protein LOC123543897 [Mercenaria mercenaria]